LVDVLGVQSWFIMGGLLCAAMGLAGFFIPSVMNIEAGRRQNAVKEISEEIEVIEVA